MARVCGWDAERLRAAAGRQRREGDSSDPHLPPFTFGPGPALSLPRLCDDKKPTFNLLFLTCRTLGDVLAQRLDRANRRAAGKPAFSGRHVAASALYGATIVGEFSVEKEGERKKESRVFLITLNHPHHTHTPGPLGHAWYKWLDTFVSARLARGTVAFVASKVVLDEIFFGPIHVAGYFGGVTLAEGGTLADAVDKIKADFVTAYTAELAFWPAFQAVNFWKVPVRHQLLAVNAACLLDATFLCWVSANEDWVGKAKGAVGWK